MKVLPFLQVLFVVVSSAVCALPAQGNTIFRDTFNDGNAEDGVPVMWTPRPDRPGDYNASSGDYILSPFLPGSSENLTSQALDFTLTDTSIRSQVRLESDGSFLFLEARTQYFAFIQRFEEERTRAGIGRSDESGQILLGSDFDVPFDILDEDAVLQFDVIGNELSLWVWPASGQMPDEPQATAVDDMHASGTVAVGASTEGPAIYRYVHVADMHIPEPSGLLLAVVGMLGLIAVDARLSR